MSRILGTEDPPLRGKAGQRRWHCPSHHGTGSERAPRALRSATLFFTNINQPGQKARSPHDSWAISPEHIIQFSNAVRSAGARRSKSDRIIPGIPPVRSIRDDQPSLSGCRISDRRQACLIVCGFRQLICTGSNRVLPQGQRLIGYELSDGVQVCLNRRIPSCRSRSNDEANKCRSGHGQILSMRIDREVDR